MSLTPKQSLFVQEYLLDLNATQAAIRAGYSARTAYSQGQRLLKVVEVQAEIAAAQEQRAEKTKITAEWVLQKAAQVFEEAHASNDRKNALRALEMCGKHVDVAAFKDNPAAAVNLNVSVGLGHFYGEDGEAG